MTEAPEIEEQPPRRISIHNISYDQATTNGATNTDTNKTGGTTATSPTQVISTVSTMTKNDSQCSKNYNEETTRR